MGAVRVDVEHVHVEPVLRVSGPKNKHKIGITLGAISLIF